jgi:hypothetical protein
MMPFEKNPMRGSLAPRKKTKSKPSDDDRSMINLTVGTKKELAELGTLNDTYETVILKLIKFWNENH